MILLIGSRNEAVMCYMIKYLREYGYNYVFMDILDHLKTLDFNENECTINGTTYPYDSFTGTFPRISSPRKQNENCKNISTLINFMIERYLTNIINKPSSSTNNFSKPYQLSSLKINIIKKPETIIRSNANGYYIENFIYKSVSSARSIVQKFLPSDQSRAITCPVLFQKLVEGANIRVHVIGKSIFSLIIHSNNIDYRYCNEAKYKPFELPSHIAQECISLTEQSNLVMAGIDLILENGEYFLLEVNPNPAFSAFERYFGDFRMSNALAKELSHE